MAQCLIFLLKVCFYWLFKINRGAIYFTFLDTTLVGRNTVIYMDLDKSGVISDVTLQNIMRRGFSKPFVVRAETGKPPGLRYVLSTYINNVLSNVCTVRCPKTITK